VQIDQSTIIDTETYYEDEEALSPGNVGDSPRAWSGRKAIEYYTVQNGDTIDQLARNFSLSHNSLRWANNLSTNVLRVGQQLIVPPGEGVIYTTKKGDTIDAISRKYKITSEKIRITNTIGDDIQI
jgi:LysM repeat protein